MGNMEIVKYLIEEKKCNIEEAREIEEGEQHKEDKLAQGKVQLTPLKIALQAGNDELVEYLIEKGAKVTPVMFFTSCKKNNLELTKNIYINLSKTMDEKTLMSTVVNGKFD